MWSEKKTLPAFYIALQAEAMMLITQDMLKTSTMKIYVITVEKMLYNT